MTQSRRDFLVRTTCAAMSAAAAQASLQKLGLMNLYARPSAPNDYRAMVCIFLDGGNDSNNMVVPTDAYYSGQYALARPANSGIQIPNVGLPGGLVSVGAPASLGGPHVRLPPEPGGAGRALRRRTSSASSRTSGRSSSR